MREREPPRSAERLIEWLVPPGDFREALLGDLREEFCEGGGGRSAGARYWARVCRMAPRLWLERAALREVSVWTGARETFMGTMRTDVVFALRLLRRRPTFAVIVLLTVALGTGAATSMFSVVDGVVVRSLPYPEADRLVSVQRTVPKWRDDPLFGSSSGRLPLTWLEYRDWQAQQTVFEAVGSWRWSVRVLSNEAGTEQVDGLLVSASLLRVLGVRPQLGRGFGRGEEGWPGARVVMISDALWRGRYGGDASVLERTLVLNGESHRIVGILPRGLRVPDLPISPDYWLPAGTQPRDTLGQDMNYETIARLPRRGTVAQAEVETGRLFRFGGTPEDGGARIVSLRADATRAVRGPFLLLLAASGLLLLITCVNVAALLLGEGSRRGAELASRLALGAAPGRLIRQLLTEQVVWSSAGAALGILFAYWATHMLVGLAPAGTPRIDEVAVNWRSYLFALAAALATALLFGLTPVLALVRESTRSASGSGARVSHRQGKLQRIAIGTQVGLAVVLLLGAMLLVQSLRRLSAEPTGFTPEKLVHIMPLFGPNHSATAQKRLYIEQVLDAIGTLPGIRSASASSSVPFTDGGGRTDMEIEADGVLRRVAHEVRVVMPGLLQTLAIPLLEGRELNGADNAASAPVAVVNRTMADRSWPGGRAIGQRISIDHAWREVVGIAGDVKHRSLARAAPPTVYIPAAQTQRSGYGLVLRVDGDLSAVIDAVIERMRAIDPTVAIARKQVVASLIKSTLAPQRFRTVVAAFFAFSAMLLTATGLFGVTADAVTRSLREMAIRVALGATAASVVRLAVRGTVVIAMVGATVGALLALGTNRAIAPYLYEIRASDAATFASVIAGTLLITALAAWVPARRAAAAEPAELLRSD